MQAHNTEAGMTFETIELQTGASDRPREKFTSGAAQPEQCNGSGSQQQDGGGGKFSLQERRRLYKKYSVVLLVILINSILALVLYYCGIFSMGLEVSFHKFIHPLEIANFGNLIEQIDNEFTDGSDINYKSVSEALRKVSLHDESLKDLLPLDQFEDIDYSTEPAASCATAFSSGASNEQQDKFVTIIMIVKSGVNHHVQREAIRRTWLANGIDGFFKFKAVFMIGACDDRNPVPESLKHLKGNWTPEDCQRAIEKESAKYGDLVQTTAADFYHNLTAKLVATFRWLCTKCQADFFLSIDDDIAFEMDNFKQYLKNLAAGESLPGASMDPTTRSMLAMKQLSRRHLYAGFTYPHSKPKRSPLHKYYISLEEYPYDRYPAYVHGGVMLMSRKTLRHFALATYFVKRFRVDDVYTGILARKLAIVPTHEHNFKCDSYNYSSSEAKTPGATVCIGVDEVGAVDLVKIWSRRRRAQTVPAPATNDNSHDDSSDQLIQEFLIKAPRPEGG